MALVFFDLDGTLTKGLSIEKRFFVFLLRGRILHLRQLAAFLIFTLRWFTHSRKDVWKKNKAYLTGLRLNKIQHLAEQFVAQVFLANLRPDVKKRLENHLAQRDSVVLLTGTPDFIAWPIAKQLGITHIAATVCDTKNGCFTSSPPGIHPLGAAKLQIAEQICRNFNTTLDKCTAYADSASDIALLASVSQPVAVYPDNKLRQLARGRGWEVIG
ncbi:MAG: HAD family phosphatase [Desulfobacteraceae bacterium]|nr:HAD family phosphatase [Desulfobacteraceae bacterium]